jgi:hypothetical protein
MSKQDNGSKRFVATMNDTNKGKQRNKSALKAFEKAIGKSSGGGKKK